MALTSLFLDMKDKNVLVVGTGSVGIRRIRRFLEAEANVYIVTKDIDSEIKDEFITKGAEFCDNDKLDDLIDMSDLVVVATNNLELNRELSIKAKDKLVNCSSNPEISNVIFPSTFYIGDVQLSIYTGSKSPLMAKTLRKKIQSIITPQDLLYIELQEYARKLLKENVPTQEERKEYMIKINEDENIEEYINDDNLDKAKEYVRNMLK